MTEEKQEGQSETEGKDLVIHFGGSGGDSEPPSDPKAQQLKSWANIIATTAALLTAVAAIFKPQDQTVNRNTYEQLKTSIEQTNQDVKQTHDDMVALHNYLAGYFAGNNTFALPPIAAASTVDAGAPVPTATVVITSPPHRDAGGPITFVIPPATKAYPLPTIGAPPITQKLPTFDSVAAKK